MMDEDDVFERGRMLAVKVIEACEGETTSCATLAVAMALVGMTLSANAGEEAAHKLVASLFLVMSAPAKAG